MFNLSITVFCSSQKILFLLILTIGYCCKLSCPAGERCLEIELIGAEVCIADETTSYPSSTFTVTNQSGQNTTLSTEFTTLEISNKTYNVCEGDSYDRPMSDRICENNWRCVYGVCKMDSYGSPSCDCDPGATGQLCQNMCCRSCVFGKCYYYEEESKEVCNCHPNYTGPFCEIWKPSTTYAPPKEVTWHYWVVGACALVLVLLVILMVVVPYILWRNRVILVMKVVHYFQGYEDDDDRQWDAFISYKSNKADETFVVKTLFPKLESEFGFKINVHFRDFIAGETIANNIITAVQGSRRTIMIITPSYVTSEFTKFEYQVAQQEMLKRKHRIIPILLEDIAQVKETMDPNLKVILNSVTYIEWPKCGTDKKMEKFWKRLELSMPKIKNRSTDSNAFSSLSNGHVSMKKPELINISLIGDNEKPGKVGTKSNVYSTIDDNKIEHEEVYDTLNEDEMQSKVFKKTPSETNSYMNVLKVDL